MFAYNMLRNNTLPSNETVSGNTSRVSTGVLNRRHIYTSFLSAIGEILSFASAAGLKEHGKERFHLVL